MAPRLSLVCPVYKVEQFIPDLIASLIRGANSPEVRVVFVNDCTPDDSMLQCRQMLASRATEILFEVQFIERERNGEADESSGRFVRSIAAGCGTRLYLEGGSGTVAVRLCQAYA